MKVSNTTCCLCLQAIAEGNCKFAIRDIKPEETDWQWFWRHVKGILSLGLRRRKYRVIIPVCDVCAEHKKKGYGI